MRVDGPRAAHCLEHGGFLGSNVGKHRVAKATLRCKRSKTAASKLLRHLCDGHGYAALIRFLNSSTKNSHKLFVILRWEVALIDDVLSDKLSDYLRIPVTVLFNVIDKLTKSIKLFSSKRTNFSKDFTHADFILVRHLRAIFTKRIFSRSVRLVVAYLFFRRGHLTRGPWSKRHDSFFIHCEPQVR